MVNAQGASRANAGAPTLAQLSADLADVHARVARSLVQVRRGGQGIGSGVVWQDDGLIVTNAHVVSGARGGARLTVRLDDGRDLAVQMVAVDDEHDLAALRIAAHGLTPIEQGDARTLGAGALLVAFGFPYGVTAGATVGSLIEVGGGAAEVSNAPARAWVAAGLHLRPGHSGGPMVDARARLVGINTLMSGPDVGVAIPVHVVQEFVRRAAAHVRREPEALVWL